MGRKAELFYIWQGLWYKKFFIKKIHKSLGIYLYLKLRRNFWEKWFRGVRFYSEIVYLDFVPLKMFSVFRNSRFFSCKVFERLLSVAYLLKIWIRSSLHTHTHTHTHTHIYIYIYIYNLILYYESVAILLLFAEFQCCIIWSWIITNNICFACIMFL